MEEKTAIPIAIEGIYHWIFFLPSKQDPRIGVPSRYFGLFDTGKVKVRGLMLRKHDTPRFVKKAQEEILEILSQAKDRKEYKETLRAKVKPLIEACIDRLMNGKMNPEELSILKRLSHDPMGYEHGTMTAAVAQELVARGVQI